MMSLRSTNLSAPAAPLYHSTGFAESLFQSLRYSNRLLPARTRLAMHGVEEMFLPLDDPAVTSTGARRS